MFPLSKGRVAKQAHVGLPKGTYEEEHGREAFEGRASHLYRTHPPTAWIRIEGDLRPRAYDLNGLKPPDMTEASAEWAPVLHNEDLAIFVSRRTEAAPYYFRDADGDLCYFVHHGTGLLETDYGPLRYRDGDYLVLPKGTTHCSTRASSRRRIPSRTRRPESSRSASSAPGATRRSPSRSTRSTSSDGRGTCARSA